MKKVILTVTEVLKAVSRMLKIKEYRNIDLWADKETKDKENFD